MISKFLLIAAAAATSIQVSQAFLTSHFVVSCGTPGEYGFCAYDQTDQEYFRSPLTVYAWDGDDFMSCESFASDYEDNMDGTQMCNNQNSAGIICSDYSALWEEEYRQSQNVLSDLSVDADWGLGCLTHDETVHQIRCKASPPDGSAVDATQTYAMCTTSGESWGQATWYLYFYDTMDDCEAEQPAAYSYDTLSGQCGSASTVTQSIAVTVFSIAAALKTVF